MKLKQLLDETNFEDFFKNQKDLYPEELNSKAQYESLFYELRSKNLSKEKESDFSIFIHYWQHEQPVVDGLKDNISNSDLETLKSAVLNKREEKSLDCFVALDFIKWETFLNLKIHPFTLENFSKIDILSHCLYELSFFSFEEQKNVEMDDILSDVSKMLDKLNKKE